MHKLDLPVIPSTTVESRRSAETARKARIFNTRLRVMGIDVNTLDHQMEEKERRQNMELQRSKAHDKLNQYNDEALLQKEVEERNKRAALNADLAQYWAVHQRVEDSRDADLKCGLKGAVRITVPENELGPASMQIFKGEGVGEKEKKREQMKNTERDLRLQMEENERKLMREKQREELLSKELMYQDLRGVQLEVDWRKAARVAHDDKNKALAAQQAERLKEQQRWEERKSLDEVRHVLSSDMMTENSEAAEINVGGGKLPRVLVDRWKGMKPEQLSTIYRERNIQRMETLARRDAEKAQKAAWDLQLLKLSSKAEEEERKAAQLRRERRLQMDLENMQLAREQQAHQEFLNKKLYTNKATKDYFHQFNTSSR